MHSDAMLPHGSHGRWRHCTPLTRPAPQTAELAAVRIELAEAQERAQIGEAVFSRSLAADNAEHQV